MDNYQRPQEPAWERKTLEKIALEGIKEQKRARRWNIFFKSLLFLYLAVILFLAMSKVSRQPSYDLMGSKVTTTDKSHIALVRLDGAISADEKANAALLASTLREAADKETVKGIVIQANSPGGSPVQSSIVFKAIQAIKQTYPEKPILTAVTDVCASGCYYIVSASDKIYADESSIVGSIGVISQSFGYEETLKKLGLDARTFTAGKNKDFLNPARPMKSEEVTFLKNLLDELHQNFISAVKSGRGDRLKVAENPDLFSGLFWTGTQALKLGLIDGIATPLAVAKEIGDYPVYDYAPQAPIEKILERFGAEAENVVSGSIQSAITPRRTVEFR